MIGEMSRNFDVENEILSECRMRSVWPHSVLGRDPLPLVQVGFEEHASGERDSTSAKV
jgi:hypothetical protein